MPQDPSSKVVQYLKAPYKAGSNSWLSWFRNQFLRLGMRSSATPVSRLLDHLPKHHRILVAGLDCAGKTTFLRNHLSQDCGRDIVTHIPMIGMCIEELSYGNVSFYTLDLGGSRKQSARQLERNLVSDMDAVIWILDSNDRDRLVEAKEEILYIICREDGLRKGAPLLILANKQSYPNAMKLHDIEQKIKVPNSNWFTHMAGADVTTGNGLLDAVKWLTEQLEPKPKEELNEKPVARVEPTLPEKS